MPLEPFQLGPLALRNRLVLPPMGTNAADAGGFVTARVLGYCEERARVLMETLQAVRNAAGPSFPVCPRTCVLRAALAAGTSDQPGHR